MSRLDHQNHLPPDILLDVRGLKVEFQLRDGTVQAVNGVNFQVKRGKTPRHHRRKRQRQIGHGASLDAPDASAG